ncbi:hypothetical protein ZYGR_0N04140 [Zygosaccharomyces rouxii]|uniref:Protein CAF130 n=1 Tax=Zygosaccharomyces rouxii TaxID=4956 RepID=A0A1Q2ZZZ1_ZYGRO|nr:hypothetical protein ZYGR_0N04140 [Zygosaccharomyces rouxii]
MVKKRKSKTNSSNVTESAFNGNGNNINKEEYIPLGALKDEDMLDLKMISLEELLAERELDYDARFEFLDRLLRDSKSWKDPQLKYSLLLEMVIVALLTTRAGLSVLALLKPSGSNPSIPKCISNQRKWLAQVERKGKLHSDLISQWQSDDDIFLKFLHFLLKNEDVWLPCENVNQCEWKVPLSFLIQSKYRAAELILDPSYNLLVDYFLAVVPLCEKWLGRAISYGNGVHLKRTVINYNRVYDFSGNFTWYTLQTRGSNHPFVSQQILFDLIDSDDKEIEAVSQIESNDQEERIQIIDQIRSAIQDISSASLNSGFYGDEDRSALEEYSDNYHHQVNQNEQVFSFDLNQDGSLELPNLMSHAAVRHEILMKVLKLNNSSSPLLQLQFKIVAGLVDPLTQPAPNDKHVISLDLLYQMFLGFLTPEIQQTLEFEEGCDWRFHVCFNMQKIIDASLVRLNFDDFERLNSINNSDDNVDWRSQLDKWLPHGFNTQDLELICMVDIIAVYTIYKLYEHLPIQLNPFLSSLISLWKNLTCVILLGLEIDRIEEELETFDTPLMVRATIRGAAALRAIVATVLNGHVEATKHDIKHESLNTFMSPHGRKLCQGALYAELRSHAAALLALGSELEDVTSLFSDLQPGDRFDEDVRYMFEYEFEDYNDLSSREEDYSGFDKYDDYTDSSKTHARKGFGRRCNCIFDDDEMLEDEDYENEYEGHKAPKQILPQQNPTTSVSMSTTGKPHAIRSGGSFEFDYSGKDWRDIPRMSNLYYSPNYHFVEDLDPNTIISLTNKATKQSLSKIESLLLLGSVATCVKNEQDEIVLGNITELHHQNGSRGSQVIDKLKDISPDDIYEMWCKDSTFEKMVYCNHEVAWRLMDEMLMCSGFRRVLIWFITHMELNHSLIHYIFELVMGLRKSFDENNENDNGDESISEMTKEAPEVRTSLPFSRQGSIQLSSIETKMLLQEFFTNAAIFLTEKSKEWIGEEPMEDEATINDGENGNVSLYAIGLMKLICLMVRAFIKKGKFDFRESECVFELQTLLMNWIAIIPEAKDLFFELKALVAEVHSDPMDDEELSNDPPDSNKKLSSMVENDNINGNETVDSEYNRKLISLLSPVMHRKEENAAVVALRNFIKKYSFDTTVPLIGRKVVYEGNEILPLPESETPMSLLDYLVDNYPPNVEHYE